MMMMAGSDQTKHMKNKGKAVILTLYLLGA
jgi:hypothetical protein